jgi:D-3-phosphoglycerate dehydrogenase
VLQVLDGKPAQFAVNAPTVPPDAFDTLQPYVELAQELGNLATQLADGQFRSVSVAVDGEVAALDNGLLATAVLKGLLEPVSGGTITLVNARLEASGRGLQVVEERSANADPYTSLLSVRVSTDRGDSRLAGTVVHGEPHIVGIDDYRLELAPTDGYLLMTRHRDQPGMIGQVGTILGQADVNISAMQVGRLERRGAALMILAVDEVVPAAVLTRLRAVPNMADVRLIKL